MIVTLLLGSSACTKPQLSKLFHRADSSHQPVQIETLKPTRFEDKILATSHTQAYDDLILSAVGGGEVEMASGAVGDRVKVGQELAHVNRRLVLAQLEAAHSQVNLARSAYLKQRQELTRSALSAAVSQLKVAKINRDHAVIASPIDGIIAEKFIIKGEVLGQGTPAYNIINISKVKVVFECAPEEIGKLKLNHVAKVTIAALNRSYPATISRLGQKANPKTGRFVVEVVFKNPDDVVKPGMIANVDIVTRVIDRAIVIPKSAIVMRDNKSVVMVSDSHQTLHEKEVRVLGQNEDRVRVSGLRAGEKIVLVVDSSSKRL